MSSSAAHSVFLCICLIVCDLKLLRMSIIKAKKYFIKAAWIVRYSFLLSGTFKCAKNIEVNDSLRIWMFGLFGSCRPFFWCFQTAVLVLCLLWWQRGKILTPWLLASHLTSILLCNTKASFRHGFLWIWRLASCRFFIQIEHFHCLQSCRHLSLSLCARSMRSHTQTPWQLHLHFTGVKAGQAFSMCSKSHVTFHAWMKPWCHFFLFSQWNKNHLYLNNSIKSL